MASHNSNLTNLKQYLKTCSRDELIDDIAKLFKRFEPVKGYYQVEDYYQVKAQRKLMSK